MLFIVLHVIVYTWQYLFFLESGSLMLQDLLLLLSMPVALFSSVQFLCWPRDFSLVSIVQLYVLLLQL